MTSGASRALLWRHLLITRERQAWQCMLELNKRPEQLRYVRTVTVDSVWRDDPQMIVNLVRMPPMAWSINLCIGPLFAPEHLDELLDKPAWKKAVEQCWFRFNPYVTQRSYYTFLKGTFFDSSPVLLSSWDPRDAPNLKRLAFEQDLAPNHGVERASVPAVGWRDVSLALDDVAQSTEASVTNSVSSNVPESTFDFAQPIVFHRLTWIDTLGQSPIGAQLTHLTLRLPRRNTVSALTASHNSFPSLVHLDISTTQVTSDPRFPALLRLHPRLESIVMDRCTGLVGQKEPDNQPALATLNWLGKCCAGSGNARAEEVSRAWYRVLKTRPRNPLAATGAANGAGAGASGRRRRRSSVSAASLDSTRRRDGNEDAASAPPLVRDLVVVPPPPLLSKLGLGLFSISSDVADTWRREFKRGYMDSVTKTCTKINEQLSRWSSWVESGKVFDQTRRMVGFKDALVNARIDLFPSLTRSQVEIQVDELENEFLKHETDPAVVALCQTFKLVPVSPVEARTIQYQVEQKWHNFNFCLLADCSGRPGVAHLSLTSVVAGNRTSVPVQETFEQRQERERLYKQRENEDRREWRQSEAVHEKSESGQRCAHVCAREAWYEED
ncbi:hypothetical protein ACM66B_002770 [Microbotryomycetes sp. NB124-2]